MDSRPLLIFDLDGARFGLDAARVLEAVWLPELTPLEEAPPWVVGLFSLRGRTVAVADLRLRFGHPARRYRPDDQVVVLETGHLPMGLIVSEVLEVVDLPGAAIQPPPRFDATAPGDTAPGDTAAGATAPEAAHLVAGQARLGDGLVILLDVTRLADRTHLPAGAAPAEAAQQPAPAGGFCPEATPAERAIFRARAAALREGAVEEEGVRLGLAVVELGGECFGVELATVQELCDVAELSPIPCCPPHVLGAMSLRGDLLTLIDPRAALGLPAGARGGKAVIARLGEQAVGIAVDEVRDVVYLRMGELQAPPPALRERCGAEIIGTAPYGERTMTVLGLPALLARRDWVVDEHV